MVERAVDEKAGEVARPAVGTPGTAQPTTGAPPAQARVLFLQRSIGNAAVSALLRGPTPLQRNCVPGHHDPPRSFDWPNFPSFDTAPREANWDVAAAGGGTTDLQPPWNVAPHFPRGYEGHEATPELDQGKVRFQQDWRTLEQSWNAGGAKAQQHNIRSMLPEVSVSEIDGQPVHTPQELRAPSAESATPPGGYQVGTIFRGDNSALDMRTPFDPGRLRGAARTEYDSKVTASTAARNERTAKSIAVDSAMVEVGTRLSQVRQAEIRVRQAQAGEGRVDAHAQQAAVTRERENISAITGAAEAVVTASIKRDRESAAGAAFGVVGAATTAYYNEMLGQIASRLAELDRVVARAQTELEMEGVVQARNNVRLQMNAVRTAITQLDTAIQQERTAFTELSQTVERLARRLGLSEEDARIAATAAGAIPMIDETIGKITEIESVLVIPTYSRSSGVGAALVTNLGEFTSHLADLKTFKADLLRMKVQWIARRSAAERGVGMPSQTAAPTAP